MSAAAILFSLIRNVLANEPVCGNLPTDTTAISELLVLAKKHSVAQLAAYAIIKNGLLPSDSPEYAAFYRKYLSVVTKVTQLEHEQAEISRVLEKAQIPHVMLKGAVMRALYPEGWMRTSSDIDTLVPEEDLDQAVTVLTQQLGYRIHGNKNYHDICLVSPSGVPLELHFSILENMDNLDCVLKDVWQHLQPIDGCSYRYGETPEFFLFHHLAHMVYHFKGGGCGIRFFLDLWIIQQKLHLSAESVRPLTDKAGITVFAEAAFRLTNHWFASAPITKTEEMMESYVLHGGCFGSTRARLAIQQDAHGGRKMHIFHRIFPSRKTLEIIYPWAKNRPWLMPAAAVHRWFSALSPQKRQRIKTELQTGNTITDAERSAVSALLTELQLK